MEANIKEGKLNDITHLGLRLAVGVIFLVHGIGKTTKPGFGGFLGSLGLPAEMVMPIALAESIGGILLINGVLNRISASVLSIIMLGAIFHGKKAENFTGQGAYEFDLIIACSKPMHHNHGSRKNLYCSYNKKDSEIFALAPKSIFYFYYDYCWCDKVHSNI